MATFNVMQNNTRSIADGNDSSSVPNSASMLVDQPSDLPNSRMPPTPSTREVSTASTVPKGAPLRQMARQICM